MILLLVFMRTDFLKYLETLPGISLDEMSAIRLMNRTDRKYLASEEQLIKLLEMVQDDYMVQVIDDKRYAEYRTTYLDDDSYTMYIKHHNGFLRRQKVRVREYLTTGDVFFEVKIKNNHGRTKKKRIEVDSPDSIYTNETSDFLDRYAILPIKLDELTPKITNHFERITLVNNAKTERLTIDTGLSFSNNVSGKDLCMNNLVIIEVKRDSNTYSPILEILRKLRIHPSGCSKYCVGIALTANGIKRNRFNIRLRRIQKITNHYV